MAEPITIDNVGKTYPGGTQALREVSLDVAPGTVLVLLGPSGSGKTTLLRCLAGIERVSSGRIVLGGRTVGDGRVHVPPDQRDLSMVFQDYALWPHLTARDNVAFGLRWRSGRGGRPRLSRAQCRARAQEMLERVGLGRLAGRYPNELSGGEQQRVALARALIGEVGLILCDEPLSNLDADLRERMRVEISALVREAAATTVYITHDQAEAFALADMVGVLDGGRLVQAGTPEEVYSRPATPFVARFTGLAGELRARVRERLRDGTVLVEPVLGGAPAARFLARAAGRGTKALDGDGALVMIRPAGVRLCANGTDEVHLSGRIADVAFRGRGYEYAVDIGGGTRLTGVLADVKAPRGQAVGLRLDPAGCHAFSPEHEGPG
ncbi:MAG TPA: ABC transporter ATP-binding protein [Streptosporangiaceae bacterium]|nr:ABC transporter ATP-binding protein [Streptosporangiaceae bacterium]